MKKFANSYIFASLFIFFSLWIRLFDVQPVGPEGSSIGFAGLNVAVHELFGMHLFWYKLTQLLGVAAIAVAAVFAVVGFIQLVQRKSLLKVDKKILMLGVIYILVILLYVLFEKVPFNYRPVVLDPAEGLEPSYPSTHTMIILTIFGTAIGVIGDYLKNAKLVLLLKIICLVIMAVTIVGRLICGVHWFTDIAGGVIISLFFINLFKDLTKEPAK
ncbi:MAG: phosphatase PAP2 family protein [Treponema sp.]|nr:phosphatase PAP2 family protein [Treponema sp.]MBR5033652.1 phosphatase PAP2 family protein [Treponema sp.]